MPLRSIPTQTVFYLYKWEWSENSFGKYHTASNIGCQGKQLIKDLTRINDEIYGSAPMLNFLSLILVLFFMYLFLENTHKSGQKQPTNPLLLSRFSHVWLPPGSAVPGILQARTLEWVAISFSSAWKWKVKVKSLSRVQLFATPWTVAHQAPLSVVFPRQEYCSGLPFPPLEDLLDPRIKPKSPTAPALQADFLQLSHWRSP